MGTVQGKVGEDVYDRDRIIAECEEAIEHAYKVQEPQQLEEQLRFTMKYMQSQNKRYAEIQSKKLEALARTRKKCKDELKMKHLELEKQFELKERKLKESLESQKTTRKNELLSLKKKLRHLQQENEELRSELEKVDGKVNEKAQKN